LRITSRKGFHESTRFLNQLCNDLYFEIVCSELEGEIDSIEKYNFLHIRLSSMLDGHIGNGEFAVLNLVNDAVVDDTVRQISFPFSSCFQGAGYPTSVRLCLGR
jgi:hypothetical protein